MHRNKLGYFFIFIGLLILLNNLDLLSGNAFILILGLGFIGIYFLLGGKTKYGNIGFLIPGSILTSIWVSSTLAENMDLGPLDGPHFLFFMGLAFVSIFLLHTITFKEKTHGDRFWPIYPALGLLVISIVAYLSEVRDQDFPITLNILFNYIWVVVFIGIGLKLILKKNRASENDTPEKKI